MTCVIARLWNEPLPLLLASGSVARKQLLDAAGIPVMVQASNIDERVIEEQLEEGGAGAAAIALTLASAKAASMSNVPPNQLVLGADQTLACEGRRFHKPADSETAVLQLQALSGRIHELNSACSVFQNGREVFSTVATVRLEMRTLSASFIATYLGTAGPSILACVGAYQLEGLGMHLFDSVEGDHATILGLPLFPLLNFLRRHGSLAG